MSALLLVIPLLIACFVERNWFDRLMYATTMYLVLGAAIGAWTMLN